MASMSMPSSLKQDPVELEDVANVDEYNELMDVLQVLGVDCVVASRFVNSLRAKDPATRAEVYR